ncbi:hypothetical protein [Burkholderia seminalis]|uniref:hypothetical protein n=1 Tax=Burkholderia seminalis TaxID=488731 RepID=UPI000F5A74E7|nr:hypothetical protein [Burkholderia seminalis]RQS88078.1 hypothetical protein DF048_27540 [Burkholderia seminalis]
MATILPNGKTQFIDSNGRPLVGGKVYFYEPNTETKKDTYTDSTATIVNANPVPLDGAGQAAIWGKGAYRQVVYDRNNVLIWDEPTEDVGAQLDSLAGSGGSAQIGFIQSGAGATARTIQDKGRERRSVKDFGGIGDGLADESAAFSLAAASAGPNGEVIVPAGIWKVLVAPETKVTWLVDSNASFVGVVTLSGRIVKLGSGGSASKGTKIGAQAAWLEQLRPFTESIAEVTALSTIGQIGIIAASRTSDFGVAGSQGCIGLAGYANNDNTAQIQTGYGGYFEARRQVGAGITQAVEIDIVNFGDTGIVYPGNMYPGNNMTSGLWLASGGDIPGARGASLALGIIANGAPFDKGLVIQAGAVTAYAGEAAAIALGMQNGIIWYDGTTNKIARIRCDATAPSVGIVFSNDTVNFQKMDGTTVFTMQNNGIININSATGGYYCYGVQVVGVRQGGWGVATGGSKAAFNAATATLAQTAAAVAQLISDARTHGLIGA